MFPVACSIVNQLHNDLDQRGRRCGNANEQQAGIRKNAEQINQRHPNQKRGKNAVEHGEGGLAIAGEKSVEAKYKGYHQNIQRISAQIENAVGHNVAVTAKQSGDSTGEALNQSGKDSGHNETEQNREL